MNSGKFPQIAELLDAQKMKITDSTDNDLEVLNEQGIVEIGNRCGIGIGDVQRAAATKSKPLKFIMI